MLSPGTFDGDNVQGAAGIDTLSYATRTTGVAVVNGVDAGLDANGDGDNNDLGDEEDTISCFEVIVTGYCDHLRELASHDRNRLHTMEEPMPF